MIMLAIRGGANVMDIVFGDDTKDIDGPFGSLPGG
jgi:hypothetical protein